MNTLHSVALVKADSTGTLGKITVIASTSGADRADDILDQSGWKLDSFGANPVILWSHNREIPAIGKGAPRVVGSKADQHLEVDIQFDLNDELGATIARKFAAGYLNAVSVGFRPGRAVPRNQLPADDPYFGEKSCYGMAYYENELTELSPCNVPCNAEALAVRTKSEMSAMIKSMDPEEPKPEDPTAADAPPADPTPADPAPEDPADPGEDTALMDAIAAVSAKLDNVAAICTAMATAIDAMGKASSKQAADISGIKADIEASGILRMTEDITLDALEDAVNKALAPKPARKLTDDDVLRAVSLQLSQRL